MEDFYSIREFAKLLKVHPQTVRNGIKCGRIQAFRIGRGKTAAFRIPYSEVQRMIKFDMKNIINELIKDMNGRAENN